MAVKRIFILLFVITNHCVYAQIYNFRNFSIEDGLTQSEITDICEDKNGNLWLGTLGGGLIKYDGYSFVSYMEESGIVDDFIRTVFCDIDGNIWIGTQKGLCVYNGIEFKHITDGKGPGNAVIRDIVQDSDKNLWIATNDSGLYLLRGGLFIHYTKESGLPNNTVNCLYLEKNGNLWIGTDHGVCKYYDGDFLYLSKREGLPSNIVRGICKDNSGNMWFATYGGITMYNSDSLTNYTVQDGLCGNKMYSALKDFRGNLWFGSNQGAIKYSRGKFKCFTEAEGLASNIVMSIYQDASLNIWFGTSGGGVSRFDSERFIHYSQNDRFGRRVYSVIQAINGNMIYGTSRGGITVFDGEKYSLIKGTNGFTDSEVKALFYDEDSTLWIGTLNDGIYRFDNNGFKHFSTGNGLKGNNITSFTQDVFKNLWASSIDSGLYVLNADSSHFIHLNTKDGLSSNSIYTVVADNKGSVWIGTTDSGLNRIYIDQNTSEVTITVYGKNEGLLSNAVRSILIDTLNRIYLGTAGGGVSIFDGNSFINLLKDNGLSSNNIYSLLFDRDMNLWIGTERGIDRITLKKDFSVSEIRHFARDEGFKGVEIYRNSCCIDDDGNLWFGTINGVTRYNPLEDHPVKISPKIHLTGIKLFFNDIQNTQFVDSVEVWYPVPLSLSLPYNQNNLTFEFTGIYLRNPGTVKYKWILEGFTDEWSPLLHQKEATFSNLSPGEYTFKVVACNEYGICSSQPAVFHFIIKTPFWQWWWLRGSVIFILAFLVWLLVFLRIKQIRKKNRIEQEKLQMEKNIIELEQEASRLQMNPHFIFNSLNSIQGFIANNDAFQAKHYLAKFARLMRLILENAREEFIPVENEVYILENYLELEKLSTNNKFDFNINISEDLNPEICEIPPMMIQPFVENAIIHGIKEKKGMGAIEINFGIAENVVICEVRDNGIGRVEAARLKAAKKPKHKSTGVSVTVQRLEQLGLQTGYKSGVEFTDLVRNGKPAGTKVTVTIPYESL